MRVAIMTIHNVVGSGRYMRDAFRRLGVDVRTVGPAPGSKIWGIELPPARAWWPDGEAQAWWPDWRPDLVVVMDLTPYHHERYADVPHVVYGVDNHVHNFRQPGIAHYFLGHKCGPEMPAEGPDVTWLPCAYDPAFFTPSPIPWRDRKFDVSMVGFMYPHRQQMHEILSNMGLKTAVGLGAVYEDFRDIYQDTRISLCLSIRGDVAQRVFETAAMGCVILSDPCADLQDLGADGVVVYRSAEDAVEAIRYLLAKPEEAEALAARSCVWARPHTWDARARAILEWYGQAYGAGR